MIYLEYERLRRKYLETLQKHLDLLDEKEAIFSRTQPKAIRYDKDRITGGEPRDTSAEYMIEIERRGIDARIDICLSVLDAREELLKRKGEELKASVDINDRVYVLMYFEGMKVYQIAGATHYSEAQIFRIRKNIADELRKLDEQSGNDSK